MKEIDNVDKFYTLGVMRYYDCGGNYQSAKAQEMIQNTNNDCIATLKSDGEWCRAIIDQNGNVILQSRSISKVTGKYGDKTAHVPHIIEALKSAKPCTVLLGELCFDDFTSTAKDVGSILRCLPEKAIQRQRTGRKLIFRVFDCLAIDGKDITDEPFEYRFNAAGFIVSSINNFNIQMCKYATENFEDFLTDILSNGGEGIVIHRKDYLYAPGGRPAWKTLKVKKTTGDIEVPVVGFIEPNKLYDGADADTWKYKIDGIAVTKPYFYGWINGIIVNHNGNEVRVTSGLTDEDREWLATDDALELLKSGKLVAVVSGMEITDSSIRHPRLIRLRTEV